MRRVESARRAAKEKRDWKVLFLSFNISTNSEFLADPKRRRGQTNVCERCRSGAMGPSFPLRSPSPNTQEALG